MIDPHREKFHSLYWDMAFAAAKQSVATRKKVGAVVVTSTGMIAVGWNGMPAGFNNVCETYELSTGPSNELVTKPEVIHAEQNAIDKMALEGVSTRGSILFITASPCFDCAKSMITLGFKAVYYAELYRCTRGIDLLKRVGIPLVHVPYQPNNQEHNNAHATR